MNKKFFSEENFPNCEFDLYAINKDDCAIEMTIAGWVKSLIIFAIKCKVKCNLPIYNHIREELGEELDSQKDIILILDETIEEIDLDNGKFESEIIFERL